MTPEQIAGTTEHSQQVAFFCAVRSLRDDHPCVNFMFAVPNGGERNIAVATRLVAEGVKKGCPDVCLPFPNGKFHSLYLEFKRPGSDGKAAGRLSKDQIVYHEYLISQNFAVYVVFDYRQAMDRLLEYLSF